MDNQFWTAAVPVMLNTMMEWKLEIIPILREGYKSKADTTALQIYLLICHAFFQTLPKQIYRRCQLNFETLFE